MRSSSCLSKPGYLTYDVKLCMKSCLNDSSHVQMWALISLPIVANDYN